MGVFDSSSDIPNQIKIEGETITVSFAPGDPASGQGTVRWNIPTPALGCNSESTGAYCGMVILLNQTPLNATNIPEDGKLYIADPNADPDLNTGDRINGALVIGAFYEGEEKSQGLPLTTELIIQGVEPKTPYYIAGYAVDCQGRHHSDGQRAYSADFGNTIEPGTPGSQTVQLGETNEANIKQGVLATDGTGLIPGMPYEFDIVVNSEFPNANGNKTIHVSGNGEDFGTYQDLLDEINAAIAQADNPPQSPTPPDQGRYYWDGETLTQWDGNEHVDVNYLTEPTDPANVAMGTYWYDPAAKQLQRFNIPNPVGWNPISTIEYHKDPTQLFGGGDYWFDGTNAYSWCATTWCEETVYNQVEDPGLQGEATCGTYWYDETNDMLKNWNDEFQTWDEAFAITWDTAPNDLTVGTYWFNETDETLNQWSGSAFIDTPVLITEEEPIEPANNALWYNPAAEELKQYILATTTWIDLTVLVWPEDPTSTESCDLWWNSTDDMLRKWDTVSSEWDVVHEFIQSETDPYGVPTINHGDLWRNPNTEEMKRWDGIRWLDVTHIEYPTPPNTPNIGVAWYNPSDDTWHVWDTPNAGWNVINPVDSENDPLSIPSGTFWFDTTNDSLYERVGSSWTAVPFSTQPYTPEINEQWFDTTNNMLMQWTRTPDDPGSWQEATPIAVAELSEAGHLIISTTTTGSNSMAMILVPPEIPYAAGAWVATGTAGLETFCGHYGQFDTVEMLSTEVTPDTFLFEYLVPKGIVMQHIYGNDGVSSMPSYEQIGIGDDGTPDERRNIMDWVRSQLGYPVVEVELTQKQIDEAVDMALETLRQRTAVAYERCFTFLETQPRQQKYQMVDKRHGYDRIVTVTSAHRFTSAFLSSAHGSGVYGQIVLQHLYNMGTFDLLSYHLVSEYIEQMEHLFATRLVFNWHEHSRILHFHQSFNYKEVILLDTMAEKTEQSIMKDRWARTWIKRFALMKGMETLAQIRGKYATLPGAGGGVSLNAADLIARSTELREELNAEVEDYIVDDPESLGINSTMILG